MFLDTLKQLNNNVGMLYHVGGKEDYLFDIVVLFLAQREEGRLNNEVRRINNEIKDLTEKRNILEVREITH